MRAAAVVILALGWLGCSKAAPPLLEEGDPCRSGTRRCMGDDLFRCTDDTWELQPCSDACTDAGLEFVACTPDPLLDFCECAPASGAECTPGDSQCNGDDVARCTSNSIWETTSCADTCAANPIPLASDGCVVVEDVASCACSGALDPCDTEGATVCADGDTLATCVGGEWILEHCICGATPGACDPFAGNEPGCTCP